MDKYTPFKDFNLIKNNFRQKKRTDLGVICIELLSKFEGLDCVLLTPFSPSPLPPSPFPPSPFPSLTLPSLTLPVQLGTHDENYV